MNKQLALACALPFTLCLACGGGSGDGDGGNQPGEDGGGSADAYVAALGPSCDLDKKIGVFEVAQRELYAAVSGQVADGVVPTTILEELETNGDCVLWRQVNPFCDPPCEAGSACDFDGSCIPYPANQSVGTVTVSGLVQEVEMEPNPVKSYQDTSLPNPPFESGSAVLLTAGGDELESFRLDGFGVGTLKVDSSEWIIVEGEPLEIAWTPEDDGPGRILATLNIDQHGNSPVTMHCDLPDTGSATIPAALLELLIDYGLSGAASGNLFRRTVDSVDISAGCVELLVTSHVSTNLSVEGFVPE